jgi:hypothetical protein
MAKQKKQKEFLQCMDCKQNKEKNQNFYNTHNKLYENVGKIPICKDCLMKRVNYDDMESIYSILRQFDIMFDITYWEKAIESKYETFKKYMTMANSLHQFSGTGWKNSIFERKNSNVQSQSQDSKENISNNELEYLKEIYGDGYPDNEYFLFEKKFLQLKPSFQLVTTLHEEYFKEYCVDKVKETLAKTRGDFKEAKEWAAMAKESAEAGKLKPSQMSKADLSQGLDGFGQLARMVEEKVDVLPILPKFVQQPKDKVDVVLWLYINYIRDLKGIPEVDYKEIFQFYEERKADYEKQELDNDPSMRVEEM